VKGKVLVGVMVVVAAVNWKVALGIVSIVLVLLLIGAIASARRRRR
jgi:uncharacterized membrane protein YuzA (DUF378 family)